MEIFHLLSATDKYFNKVENTIILLSITVLCFSIGILIQIIMKGVIYFKTSKYTYSRIRYRVAVHEAGHYLHQALVPKDLKKYLVNSSAHVNYSRASLKSRGNAIFSLKPNFITNPLGYLIAAFKNEKFPMDNSDFKNWCSDNYLAGCAAEYLIFGNYDIDLSTDSPLTATNDLNKCFEIGLITSIDGAHTKIKQLARELDKERVTAIARTLFKNGKTTIPPNQF